MTQTVESRNSIFQSMKQVTKPTPSRMVTPRAFGRSFPNRTLRGPGMNATVYVPSHHDVETFYRAARFDWGSMIGPFRLRVPWGNGTRGVTLCTGGRRRQNATDPAHGVGLASEFGCGVQGAICPAPGGMKVTNGVLGYGSAGPNGIFLKLVRASILCPAARPPGYPASHTPRTLALAGRRQAAAAGGVAARGRRVRVQLLVPVRAGGAAGMGGRRGGRRVAHLALAGRRARTLRLQAAARRRRVRLRDAAGGVHRCRADERRGAAVHHTVLHGQLLQRRRRAANRRGVRRAVQHAWREGAALRPRPLECVVGDGAQRPRGARPAGALAAVACPPQCYRPACPTSDVASGAPPAGRRRGGA